MFNSLFGEEKKLGFFNILMGILDGKGKFPSTLLSAILSSTEV